jgi:hypothetical protein
VRSRMRKNLNEAINHCQAHAVYCEEKARTSMTEDMRADFLRLRESWLSLANSYEVAEQSMGFDKAKSLSRP